jgi:AmmeMemoRadiSam system protein B
MSAVREAAMAGMFYPASASQCEAEAADCCRLHSEDLEYADVVKGGLVPHAAWSCSGRVAGRVLALLARARVPQTVVLFGTMHRVRGRAGLVFPAGKWETPSGKIEVDDRFAERLLGQTTLIEPDAFAHEAEHSVEVQVPFIQRLMPQARIVPILVPPVEQAAAIGQAVGRTIETYRCDAAILGTTDLTHYGLSYGFTPKGTRPDGFEWAKQVNDRRILELITALQAEAVVEEAGRNRNACGAGAVAATIGAVTHLGATRGVVLEHTTSREVLGDRGMGGAVGYAGVIFT